MHGFGISIHIALLWSAGIRASTLYKHIAPLERKIGSINFNRKPMELNT